MYIYTFIIIKEYTELGLFLNAKCCIYSCNLPGTIPLARGRSIYDSISIQNVLKMQKKLLKAVLRKLF